MAFDLLKERAGQVVRTGTDGPTALTCDRVSVAGSVSQRACTFCGSRVVLYPIADALHLVHGPIGCAAYTWDIRGALSSGPELHRISCSTDLRERDVVFGGEKRLEDSLRSLIAQHSPRAAFVYATCIAGVIGDDVAGVCARVAAEVNIPVIPVLAEGFRGTKRDGYSAACRALLTLIGTGDVSSIGPLSINLLGDFNVAGESWIIKKYFEELGVEVVSVLTGDGRVDEIRRAHGAKLNVVQCAGSMTPLAKAMQEQYGIPFIRVSFFGIEDTADALYRVAEHLGDSDTMNRASALVRREITRVMPELRACKDALAGKRAGLYVGGAFKAFSLVRALRQLGVAVVLAGTQTGSQEEYEELQTVCDDNTVVVDDTNPLELASFLVEQDVDVFIGGVKERPIAFKLGIGFCDHNHERKIPLAGFDGAVAFAQEIRATATSPVWDLMPRRARPRGT
ncbi:MAG TPA: nitrogenase iron-molybdenum cofactor biosynthesis protein NifE, partial [Polyangia bacterium]